MSDQAGGRVTDAVDFSLVIACYNEAPHLEASVAETLQVLDALVWSSEIIFVDDASQDSTRAVIDRVVAANPTRRMTVLTHAKNVGRGGTVRDGLRVARGAFAGFIDIDLEVHARYILPCLLALQAGADVATAQRVYRFQWRSLDRFLMSRGYYLLMTRMLDVSLLDTETGFKFFRRDRILPVLDRCQDVGWFWDTEIMVRAAHAGLAIVEIPTLFTRRFDKRSTVQPFRDSMDYLRKLWRFRAALRHMRSSS